MMARWQYLLSAVAVAGLALVWPLASPAAPGPLAQVPILASASSAPNILIVIDDSGSMGWRRSGQ
ncbi:MAG TPA: hypothetical protein QGH18_07375, partial [Arenicellales bacterium]|nr:hypothetical protein [Arenicellales bacterium]